MSIRQINASDRGEWLRMRRTLWPDCSDAMHSLEIEEQIRRDAAGAVFVFEREGGSGLGAFIELSIRDRVDGSYSERVGYVEGWYVDADLRGGGVGRQLMARAEEWAIACGFTELASDAEIENEGSINAHHALGFRETFRLAHFIKQLKKES
ncbi:MAG: GNAT family N-acetyltransferase [Pyrinomonadaceae bacterium]